MTLPLHDEVHVISDLHMGGVAGFQILREAGRLAKFIRLVAGERPDDRVALVLNGDTIDTLAEASGGYIAVDNAVPIVNRIIADPSFSPVWDSLADFVKRPGRSLIFVLGNHDLELSFQPVQNTIVQRLAGNDISARGRISFSTMGAGYACEVGGKRVFCTHGNEVDAWNFVRYEDLAKAGRRLSSGRHLKPSEWEPNAGTKMVKDVMNDIKEQYRWIDLLKPEIEAAIGVLLALDPDQFEKIDHVIPVVGELIKGKIEYDQRLSADGFQFPVAGQRQPASLDRLLGPNFKEAVLQPAGTRPDVAELLRQTEQSFKTFNAEEEIRDGTLGLGGYLWDRLTGWLRGVDKPEALRRALRDWLAKDKSFNIADKDATCKGVLDTIGPGIDFIVTGHTHLERAIDLGGGRFYFNCGTWIRLLGITAEMLKDEKSFEPVYEVLRKERDMDAIDQAKFGEKPFVRDQCSAVRIRYKNGTVAAGLFHVQWEEGGQNVQLVEVKPDAKSDEVR